MKPQKTLKGGGVLHFINYAKSPPEKIPAIISTYEKALERTAKLESRSNKPLCNFLKRELEHLHSLQRKQIKNEMAL